MDWAGYTLIHNVTMITLNGGYEFESVRGQGQVGRGEKKRWKCCK